MNCELRATSNERRATNTGFTLVEVLIAIILVGIAIAALVGANISFTQANGTGTELSTAEFLIEQIRERTTPVNYTSLLSSFDDKNFWPPINANGEVLNDFAGFTQQITVQNVNKTNFQTVVPDGTSDFVRITVKILLNGKEISETSWIRAQY